MHRFLVFLFAAGMLPAEEPCRVVLPPIREADLARGNHHRVSSRGSPAREPGQEATPILSPLIRDDGGRVTSAREWYGVRRPELVEHWRKILGKIGPAPEDRKWFGDVTRVHEHSRRKMDGYTRIDLDIPLEIDFHQRHLLLVPDGQGQGPFPTVIAWTSSTPDYREPEYWWGSQLARSGYVVLTSWAFIRNYRQGSRGAPAIELLYQRFGRWLAISKMVHDVEREVEYLRTLPQVDAARIGFIGFSLSAKTAVYAGALAPSIQAVVSIDPGIALNGGTNWYDAWYMDWLRKFPDIETREQTVLSLLNPDPARPGFEHDHHELLAMAAPRPFLLIAGSCHLEDSAIHSDDLQSLAYYNRAKEVYQLLGIPERLLFAATIGGHASNGPQVDPAWRSFFDCWLKTNPVRFQGYTGEYGR